ncbi:MAG: DUF2089 domain-containing protein [Chloroflexota bacterium]|nr:MAG: DUF2089 domain-containing protein [Chloroflexota bacterium]
MNKLIWKCPVCTQELHVTALECASCGTELRGHFELGRFARLGMDELNFIEIFVKNRGNAYRVAEELEIPYSGVRSRLTEIIQAMGYDEENESPEEAGLPPERRKEILEQVSNGKISSEQAVKLLQGDA